jgi:hypothetical protein
VANLEVQLGERLGNGRQAVLVIEHERIRGGPSQARASAIASQVCCVIDASLKGPDDRDRGPIG